MCVVRCPACNRKFDIKSDSQGKFKMPEHQNYMKTAPCKAGGKNFVNASGRPVDARMRNVPMSANLRFLTLATLAAMGKQ